MKSSLEQFIVFTDLDGTLLNHDDYSFEAAIPAINRLKKYKIPLILVTSKTIEEVRTLRNALDIDWPYICENGSLLVFPDAYSYLGDKISGARRSEKGESIYLRGSTRSELLDMLEVLRHHYKFTQFSKMSTSEIMECTGLNHEEAVQANLRLASEPLLWQDEENRIEEFTARVLENNLQIIKGGRFYHIMGNTDKSEAVEELKLGIERYNSTKAHSIVLGDSENDLAMLRSATTAIVIPKLDGSHLQLDQSESVVYALKHGASGWCESILEILNQLN